MAQFKFNDVELPVAMTDADFMDRYAKAFAGMQETIRAFDWGDKSISYPAKLRTYCEAFQTLFDDIYGEGTSKKLFNDTCDAEACENAFLEFCVTAESEMQRSTDRRAEMADKLMSMTARLNARAEQLRNETAV